MKDDAAFYCKNGTQRILKRYFVFTPNFRSSLTIFVKQWRNNVKRVTLNRSLYIVSKAEIRETKMAIYYAQSIRIGIQPVIKLIHVCDYLFSKKICFLGNLSPFSGTTDSPRFSTCGEICSGFQATVDTFSNQ